MYGHFLPMLRPSNISAILAYDGLCVFEFGIAFELFGLERPELGTEWYDCQIIGLDGPRTQGPGCIHLESAHGLDELDLAQTIVIPGWRDRAEVPPTILLEKLRGAHARGARLMSICSGAFVLAYAGLLDGKRATTHWLYAEDFQRRFPAVDFEADVLYVDEGNIITSAGSAAGIDAGIHLIRKDFGARVANMVARRLVIPPHREGGQAQYVETPVTMRPGRSIGQIVDWVRSRLDEPLTVAMLARQAAMSERTFLRQFENAMGMSPGAWIQTERIARARELLESTKLTLDDVGLQCGYQSLETFRAAFKRVVGLAPGLYRSRFSQHD